ncbi:CBS domain-containing protein [Neorhizobium petrolearium]|uniref:CBS domain-containing protein n=1 Tax=Neorhizobium petrolearium TaxID=515361 RepID=UPI003F7DB7EC
MLPIQSVMTLKPTTIGPDAKIWEAANLMLDRRISGLPVVNGEGHLLGVISESDFLCRGELHAENRHGLWRALFASRESLAGEYAKAFGQNVEEVMSSPAITAEPGTPIAAAAELMAENNIKRLPVVEDGKLVGIVTRSDIMSAFVRELARHSAAKADADIKNALEAELARHNWGDAAVIKVAGGVVTLEGKVLHEREKAALRVAAENVTGVKRVDDRIELVAPLDMPVPPPGFYL